MRPERSASTRAPKSTATPTTMNVSARLNAGQASKSRKSVTRPSRIRSTRFATLPPSTSPSPTGSTGCRRPARAKNQTIHATAIAVIAITTVVRLEKKPNAIPEFSTWWIEKGPRISTLSPTASVRPMICFVSWSATTAAAATTRSAIHCAGPAPSERSAVEIGCSAFAVEPTLTSTCGNSRAGSLTPAPGRQRLPPGRAGLRRRLTTLAARDSPGPYRSYCALRPRTASAAPGTGVSCASQLARVVDAELRVGDGLEPLLADRPPAHGADAVRPVLDALQGGGVLLEAAVELPHEGLGGVVGEVVARAGREVAGLVGERALVVHGLACHGETLSLVLELGPETVEVERHATPAGALSRAASSASLRPSTTIVLSRELSPATISIRLRGISSVAASSSRSAWLALPLSGGAPTRTFHASPSRPTIRERAAPGLTRRRRRVLGPLTGPRISAPAEQSF